jgi:hypothetical protein
MTWINEPEFEGSDGREIVSGHTLIATVYNTTDAHLIAAAPDLLAALEAAAAFVADEVENRCAAGSEMSDYQDEARHTLDQIETAITKAKGN